MDKFDSYVAAGLEAINLHPDFHVDAPINVNEAGDDMDTTTAASDMIATILHGVFGRQPAEAVRGEADAILGSALRCWEGDYEDMVDIEGLPKTIDCECGAGPFSDEEAVERHRQQWHPGGKVPVDYTPGPSAEEPKRTILVHLNVEVPGDDERGVDDIAQLVKDALDVGMEGPGIYEEGEVDEYATIDATIALSEEV